MEEGSFPFVDQIMKEYYDKFLEIKKQQEEHILFKKD